MRKYDYVKRVRATEIIFEEIKEIADDYLKVGYPEAPDPDYFMDKIKKKVEEYEKLWGDFSPR